MKLVDKCRVTVGVLSSVGSIYYCAFWVGLIVERVRRSPGHESVPNELYLGAGLLAAIGFAAATIAISFVLETTGWRRRVLRAASVSAIAGVATLLLVAEAVG
jgi:hypothetical protein